MPCRILSHTHKWPRSGTLSISKCEFKCDFCPSTKEYKPASALRKHVLTHIKNDKMPLTLDKSTGGRPRLQITAIDSSSRDQPETYPPSSELTLTSEPVLGTLDANGETINTIDDIFFSIKDMLPGEEDSIDLAQFRLIPDALMIVEAAVGLSKTLGSEKTLIRRGLDCLRICMVECRETRKLTKDSEFHRNPSDYTGLEEYRAFRRALYDTTQDSRYSYFPKLSVMVLEILYATWILSIIIRYSCAHEDNGFLKLVSGVDFIPMLLYNEAIADMTLDELCEDVHRASLPAYLGHNPGYWGQSHIQNTYLALKLYRQSIFGPADINVSRTTVAEIMRLFNEDVISTRNFVVARMIQ